MFRFNLLLLTIFITRVQTEVDDGLTKPKGPFPHRSYPQGDPRACEDGKESLQLFEVLPGYGWDNLRNVDGGSVVVYNYSLCKTTLDGRFLIPDDVETLSRKSSRVNTFAEVISHLHEYSSITSRSVNINVGLQLPHVQISGSFSDSYQHAKSKKIGSKHVVTRVQLRYTRYTARLKAGGKLGSEFKDRLLAIASYLDQDRKDMARFKSQLLVRDFGTHYLYSVDAGAVLVQEDEISSEFAGKDESTKSEIKVGASASFFSIFNFSMSYSSSSASSQRQRYEKNRTSSEILAFGGPKFKANDFTANDWTNGVDENLVAIDRSGEPLQFLITPSHIPELSEHQVQGVSNMVSEAVELYYKHNTYAGCMQPNSSNFNPSANVDDGTCTHQVTKSSFGGAFQKCSLHPGSNYKDYCKVYKMDQKNPLTGGYSCPDGFTTVKIHSSVISTPKPNSNCFICDGFYLCCTGERYYRYKYSQASYSLFWCAATKPLPKDSGYLFGGLYTSKINNPLTKNKNCPINFYPLRLGMDTNICISDDFELGGRYSVPFGGFISCEAGNPLAVGKREQDSKLKSDSRTLGRFFHNEKIWPKRCPSGHSKHLAFVDQGCEVNYCAKLGSVSSDGNLRIKLPPFMNPSEIIPPLQYKRMKPSNKGTGNASGIPGDKNTAGHSSETGLSSGSVAGIAIGCLFVGVVVAFSVIVIINLNRKASKRRRDGLVSSNSEYGSTESST